MTSLQLLHHEAPRLRIPTFAVDGKLHAKLDDYELSRLMNRSHCAAFVGRAGSGKTSMAVSMLQSKDLFRKVFTKIVVVMPATSRASLKKNPFEHLPPSQIFDELTLPNLESIFKMAQAESKEGGNTLLLLDDVQAAMKLTPIERLLVHCNNNRRHNRLSIWICCQNLIKLPRSLRMGLTNLFLFSVSKADMHQIHEELLEISEPVWERICKLFKADKAKSGHEKDFLFVDVRDQRYFLNWSEVVLPKDDESAIEADSSSSSGSDSDSDEER
jgi:hypothetical protein